MNKLEVLETVKKRVEEQGVKQYYYVSPSEGGQCFCAIGHVMDVCGVNLDLFKENSFLNKYGIDKLFMENASEFVDVEKPMLDDYILDPLKDAGFTMYELTNLQNINDTLDSDEARKEKVIAKLDRMIAYEKQFKSAE